MTAKAERRRELDRERKRLAREQSRGARPAPGTFTAWFAARVDELPQDRLAWSNRLANAMEELGYISDAAEYDRSLRKIHSGVTERPRASTTFAIGEALRECGARWVSGAAALHAGGYLREFYAVLSELAAPDDHNGLKTALRYAYATQRANMEPCDMPDAPFVDDNGAPMPPAYTADALAERLNTYHKSLSRLSRDALAEAEVTKPSTLRECWFESQDPRFRAELEVFRMVMHIASSETLSIEARERASLTLIDVWASDQFPGTRLDFLPDFVADLRPISLALRARELFELRSRRREHSRKDTQN
jgi:hypothetical protein